MDFNSSDPEFSSSAWDEIEECAEATWWHMVSIFKVIINFIVFSIVSRVMLAYIGLLAYGLTKMLRAKSRVLPRSLMESPKRECLGETHNVFNSLHNIKPI